MKDFVWLMFNIAVVLLALVGLDTLLKGDASIEEHLQSLENRLNSIEDGTAKKKQLLTCVYNNVGELIEKPVVIGMHIELNTFSTKCPVLRDGIKTTLRILP